MRRQTRPASSLLLLAAGLTVWLVAQLAPRAEEALSDAPLWIVAELDGRVQLRDSALEPWRELRPEEPLSGSWALRTEGSGGVLLHGPGGTIEIGPATVLSANARAATGLPAHPSLTLRRGLALFALEDAELRVVTSFFTVGLHGTRFVVEVGERHGAATVGEGAIDLAWGLDGRALRLEAGQTALVDDRLSVERAGADGGESERARHVARQHLAHLGAPLGELASGRERPGGPGTLDGSLAPASASELAEPAAWEEIDDSLGAAGGDELTDDDMPGDFPDDEADEPPVDDLPGDDPPDRGDDDESDLPGGGPFDDFPDEDDMPGDREDEGEDGGGEDEGDGGGSPVDPPVELPEDEDEYDDPLLDEEQEDEADDEDD